ncbi:MAG: XRE family transcriptional regulator [Bacteroidia bacterium]|nr:XRE family transcriptional regulator [Bacteroidia bacterium]
MEYKFNSNKLKGLIAEKGINQSDVAKLLELSENQTSKKINGKVDFKVTEISKLSTYFNVKPDIFFAINVDKIRTTNTNI